jgi:hypothetical protein
MSWVRLGQVAKIMRRSSISCREAGALMPDEIGPDQHLHPAPESVLLAAENIYKWRGRVMGRTIFNAHVGTLILTNYRLIFVSSGGTDVWNRMARAGLAFAPQPVANTVAIADATAAVASWINERYGSRSENEVLNLSLLKLLKDGSLIVPLIGLDEFGVTERTFSSFLWIAFTSQDGKLQEFAFSDKIFIPGDKIWESQIKDARTTLFSR